MTTLELVHKHAELTKRIGYENLLNLPEGEKKNLKETLKLEDKVQMLEKIALRMGV